jgi:hypothetical protein
MDLHSWPPTRTKPDISLWQFFCPPPTPDDPNKFLLHMVVVFPCCRMAPFTSGFNSQDGCALWCMQCLRDVGPLSPFTSGMWLCMVWKQEWLFGSSFAYAATLSAVAGFSEVFARDCLKYVVACHWSVPNLRGWSTPFAWWRCLLLLQMAMFTYGFRPRPPQFAIILICQLYISSNTLHMVPIWFCQGSVTVCKWLVETAHVQEVEVLNLRLLNFLLFPRSTLPYWNDLDHRYLGVVLYLKLKAISLRVRTDTLIFLSAHLRFLRALRPIQIGSYPEGIHLVYGVTSTTFAMVVRCIRYVFPPTLQTHILLVQEYESSWRSCTSCPLILLWRNITVEYRLNVDQYVEGERDAGDPSSLRDGWRRCARGNFCGADICFVNIIFSCSLFRGAFIFLGLDDICGVPFFFTRKHWFILLWS